MYSVCVDAEQISSTTIDISSRTEFPTLNHQHDETLHATTSKSIPQEDDTRADVGCIDKEWTSDSVEFTAGNPRVEHIVGLVHLFREMRHDSHAEHDAASKFHGQLHYGNLHPLPEDRQPVLCCLAMPADMSLADFCSLVEAFLPTIRSMRVLRREARQRTVCMVLIRFQDQAHADLFYDEFNMKPFSSLEPEIVCRLVYVRHVQILQPNQHHSCVHAPHTAANTTTTVPAQQQVGTPTIPNQRKSLDKQSHGSLTPDLLRDRQHRIPRCSSYTGPEARSRSDASQGHPTGDHSTITKQESKSAGGDACGSSSGNASRPPPPGFPVRRFGMSAGGASSSQVATGSLSHPTTPRACRRSRFNDNDDDDDDDHGSDGNSSGHRSRHTLDSARVPLSSSYHHPSGFNLRAFFAGNASNPSALKTSTSEITPEADQQHEITPESSQPHMPAQTGRPSRRETEQDVGNWDKLPQPVLGTELPTCPVCLERLDEHISGVVITVCNHQFHSDCLKKWGDTSCPVCRYCTQAHANASRCASCSATTDLWICLICGNVGCGRYKAGHAADHWKSSNHCYALELESQRVWSYADDNYVHRLIQSKTDGKLVEVPTPGPPRRHRHGRHSAPSMCSAEARRAYSGVHRSRHQHQPSDGSECYEFEEDGDDWDADQDPHDDDMKEAMIASKLDHIADEYNHLLASQLDSQRAYYENLLAQQAASMTQRISTAEAAAAAQQVAVTSAVSAQKEAERKKQSLEKKLADMTAAHAKAVEEKGLLQALNDTLLSNQKQLQTMLEKSKAQVQEKEAMIQDLQEQVRDLMVFIEAGKVIQSSGELQDATLLPTPVPTGSTRGRNRRSHR